jgi:hypothetical protein
MCLYSGEVVFLVIKQCDACRDDSCNCYSVRESVKIIRLTSNNCVNLRPYELDWREQ